MPSVHPVKSAGALNTVKAPVIKSILISLLRQSEHVIALLGDEVDGVLQPVLSQVNLAELDTSLFPQTASLLDDWHSLQNAHDLASVWPAFWRVFWMTVPDADNIQTSVMPQTTVQKKPVATAAHPRAFRGTKYQPPKPALPVLDLCKWLAGQRLLDVFFAQHDFTALPALDAQGQIIPLPQIGLISSAALFFNHWKTPVQALPVLPDGFRRHFLWSLRACSVDQQLAWLQIWHRHHSMYADDVHRIENLGLLARLCALYPSQCHAAELAQVLPASRQNIFLRLLIQEVQGQLSSSQMSMEQLMRLHELTEIDTRFEYYLGSILSNLCRQISVEYSLAGCLLSELHGDTDVRKHSLIAFHDCQEELVDIIVQACDCAGKRIHTSLWRDCSELPGLAQLLRATCWSTLTAQTADNLINVVLQFRWLDDDAERLAKWRAYLKTYPEFLAALIQLKGEHQEKFALLWYQLIDSLHAVGMFATVIDALPLMQMLSQAPYANEIDYGYALPNLNSYLPTHLRRRLPDLGERFWSRFERACRRENETRLLACGIAGMAELGPDLLWQSLQSAAPRLFHTLQLLGSMEYDRRLQFMREQMQTDWFVGDWATLDAQTASQKILALSQSSQLDSPLPRRLRLHFEGEITLTERQVQRHCQMTLTRFPALRLRALEQAIWQDMDKSFQLRAHSAPVRHALRLLAGLDSRRDSNRKGLRRFLQKAKAGQVLSYLDHPLNLAWYAAHPSVSKTQWQTGLQKTCTIDGASVQLSFEQDPFEILQLGTYVGSCLSVGGYCDYSAVACRLDANKQVVYARNEKGRVIARQLVAIDEKDRLLCYAIYPYQCSSAMKAAFKTYDQELAGFLGLELYGQQVDSDYDVTTILAQGWWDDCPRLEE